MPVYVIEFVTSDARPQQRRFTLDDDRPLRPQVEHVLAELERGGLVLRGGPADELVVRWAGQEVDAARPPAALGLTPDRPVELRMQRRRAPVIVAPPPPAPEAPPTPFVPRAVYAGAAFGAAGAWLAWTVAGAITDGGADGAGPLAGHSGLDAVLGAAFGVLVGGAVGFGAARRAAGTSAAGAALGALAGLLAALVWAVLAGMLANGAPDALLVAPDVWLRRIVERAVTLAALAALVTAAVALATGRWTGAVGRSGAAARAASGAAVGGLIAGGVLALPGPVELWSALGVVVTGASVGAATAWAAARRAVGVLSLEAIGERGPGVLSLREWALADGRTVALPGMAGDPAPTLAVAGTTVTQTVGPAGAPRPVRQDDRLRVGAARYRFRRCVSRAVVAPTVVAITAAALATTPGRSPAQTAGSPDAESVVTGPIERATLVRCVADRPLPCVEVRVTLPRDAAVRDALAAGAADIGLDEGTGVATAARATGWSGRLGPYTLEPVQVRVARAGGPRRAVLTLVDVSGSMRGDGMQVARTAVRAFLRDLGAGAAPGAVQAALGAFASRNVAANVQGAAFATPETVAGNVDLLPAPAGNTGLYSAVALGAERVATAAREAGAGTRAALVVITDGVNDVTDPAGRPRVDDDPGLLRGAEGRAAAAATAQRLGVDLYLVGVGPEPDMNELQALAGGQGRAFRTARDALALRAALGRIDAALAPTRDVLFAVPGAERASLARPEWRLTVTDGAAPASAKGGANADARAVAFAGMWPAPVLGTPVFRGDAFRADGRGPTTPSWLRAAADDAPRVDRRMIVSVFVALLVAIGWALPRALWQPVAWSPGVGATPRSVTPAVVTPVTDATLRQLPLRPVPAGASGLPAVATVAVNGLAPDVRDAPPRRPEDVTAQRVRQNGTRPASLAGGVTAMPRAQPAAPPRP